MSRVRVLLANDLGVPICATAVRDEKSGADLSVILSKEGSTPLKAFPHAQVVRIAAKEQAVLWFDLTEGETP